MPDQIFAGESFNNGEQVSATRLNDHVGHAVLLKGCITQQIPHGAINIGDKILSYDSVEDGLRSVEISQILGAVSSVSGLPVGSNIELNPYEGNVDVTPNNYGARGASYTCYTSTVNEIKIDTDGTHLVQAGDIIYISGGSYMSLSGYYKIFSIGIDYFRFYTYDNSLPAHTGLITWNKVKEVKINGSLVIGNNSYILGNQYVDGNLWISGAQKNVGAVSMTGAVSLTGALTQSGVSTFSGATTFNGATSITVAPTTANHVVNKSYVDGASSKLANGYCTLPGGIIMQWGRVSAYGTTSITLPISFVTAVLWVSGTSGSALATGTDNDSASAAKNGASLTTITVTDDGNGCSWIAIGY